MEAAAAANIRSLKAKDAPVEEVKAAIEAYNAQGGSQSESRGESKAQFSSIEAAAENVRRLKARKASQAEVKAAVAAYLTLEEAVENVRRLKASKAPQAQVKAAVDAYVSLTNVRGAAPAASSPALEEAKEHIRVLKARMAPQSEVRAAVEKFVSLKYGTPLPAPEPERKWEENHSVVTEEPAPQVAAEESSAKRTNEEPVSKLSLPGTAAEAAELVKSLKAKMAPQSDVRAAVAHYVNLTRDSKIAAAAERVEAAKKNKAPQAELDAATAAYTALTQPTASAPSATSVPAGEHKEEVRAAVDSYVELKDALPESSDPAEAAAARIRDLKARHATAEEVKAAVSEYVSAKGLPAPQQPTKPAEVAVKSAEVDAAEKVVKDLKAKMASQAEVRTAVDAYLALKYPSRAAEAKSAEHQEASRPHTELSESAAAPQSPVDLAMAKVRELKAARASQEQVTAAVEEYKRLRAASGGESESAAGSPLDAAVAKVRALKEARASQAEVSAAVEEYKALRAQLAGSHGKATAEAKTSDPQTSTKEVPSTEEPSVRMHLPNP